MRKVYAASVVLALALLALGARLLFRPPEPDRTEDGFAGSSSCRGCHEAFYQRWAPSHHGLAMQPYTADFARSNLTPTAQEIAIAGGLWSVDFSGARGWVVERGAGGVRKHEIHHVMGGKNVFYFLTPLDGGRLQVLPVAYDVRSKVWYDTAASAVRHFPDMPDAPLDWTERPFTFNSSCWGCHVSQLQTNYDPATDSYHSRWAEPGINCETCHGPAGEHVRVFQQAKDGETPPDLKIIKTSGFSPEQTNDMCAPCHAKMVPLTTQFRPGDRYFDHFDLIGFEHPDFYPDGRDLGENYTYTLWRSSPCVAAGKLDCLHCHTSSGRYRFDGERANEACLPCHEDKVRAPSGHTRHKAGGGGSQCVACHMPMTEFARMRRSDHSMRAPAPAATIRFQSPNACNNCHTDRDADWADRLVRQWHKRDYQAPVLRRGELIAGARKRDWSRLKEMLAYIRDPGRDEITAASLIRLLRACDDPSIWSVLRERLNDPSPLVRASAAETLAGNPAPETLDALARAAGDEYRLVRIKAAWALSRLPRGGPDARVEAAMAELESSMRSRLDDPASLSNLGNFYMSRGELERAIQSYEASLKLEPAAAATLVNASLAYNQAGRNDRAEDCLRRAVKAEPKNAAAHFNLGLLLGEEGRPREAKQALRAALNAEPTMAAAAYNLCILEAPDNPGAALALCRQAAGLRPEEPRYAYTLAFYLHRNGNAAEAAAVLRNLLGRHPAHQDGRRLLMEIEAGRKAASGF
ncbi:MAG: ammonia-forming cytochrome c nitrite reductase subunit c552 [Bryobacteraceae bacterium]|nr:ammonia-forming cytochrome c nitrite reductase subunit c552 [Bryobacteraceae bacterium]